MTNPDCRENYKLIVSGKTNKGPSLALLRTYTDKRHSFPRIRLSQTILVKMRLLWIAKISQMKSYDINNLVIGLLFGICFRIFNADEKLCSPSSLSLDILWSVTSLTNCTLMLLSSNICTNWTIITSTDTNTDTNVDKNTDTNTSTNTNIDTNADTNTDTNADTQKQIEIQFKTENCEALILEQKLWGWRGQG